MPAVSLHQLALYRTISHVFLHIRLTKIVQERTTLNSVVVIAQL